MKKGKKKAKIIIFLLHFVICSYAQKGEKIIAKAVYLTTYSKNNRTLIIDSCELDVSNSYSYFYSLSKNRATLELEKKMRQAIVDKTPLILNSVDTRSISKFLSFSVLKKYSPNSTFIIESIGESNFAYSKDNLSNDKWNLINDSLLINGFTCYKAIINDTFKITAWYLPTFPISIGPLFYEGLPGLIVKVESERGWKAELVSLKQFDKLVEDNNIPFSYQVVSKQDFDRAKRAYSESKLNGGNIGSGDANIKLSRKQ
jgi:GLPGLI family protein